VRAKSPPLPPLRQPNPLAVVLLRPVVEDLRADDTDCVAARARVDRSFGLVGLSSRESAPSDDWLNSI
jgi:hypothetical protein